MDKFENKQKQKVDAPLNASSINQPSNDDKLFEEELLSNKIALSLAAKKRYFTLRKLGVPPQQARGECLLPLKRNRLKLYTENSVKEEKKKTETLNEVIQEKVSEKVLTDENGSQNKTTTDSTTPPVNDITSGTVNSLRTDSDTREKTVNVFLPNVFEARQNNPFRSDIEKSPVEVSPIEEKREEPIFLGKICIATKNFPRYLLSLEEMSEIREQILNLIVNDYSIDDIIPTFERFVPKNGWLELNCNEKESPDLLKTILPVFQMNNTIKIYREGKIAKSLVLTITLDECEYKTTSTILKKIQLENPELNTDLWRIIGRKILPEGFTELSVITDSESFIVLNRNNFAINWRLRLLNFSLENPYDPRLESEPMINLKDIPSTSRSPIYDYESRMNENNSLSRNLESERRSLSMTNYENRKPIFEKNQQAEDILSLRYKRQISNESSRSFEIDRDSEFREVSDEQIHNKVQQSYYEQRYNKSIQDNDDEKYNKLMQNNLSQNVKIGRDDKLIGNYERKRLSESMRSDDEKRLLRNYEFEVDKVSRSFEKEKYDHLGQYYDEEKHNTLSQKYETERYSDFQRNKSEERMIDLTEEYDQGRYNEQRNCNQEKLTKKHDKEKDLGFWSNYQIERNIDSNESIMASGKRNHEKILKNEKYNEFKTTNESGGSKNLTSIYEKELLSSIPYKNYQQQFKSSTFETNATTINKNPFRS